MNITTMQMEESECDICRLNLAKHDWRDINPSQRCKFFHRDGLLINLREFTKNSDKDDDEWCESKHIGYRVQGKDEIDFGLKKSSFGAATAFLFLPEESTKCDC